MKLSLFLTLGLLFGVQGQKCVKKDEIDENDGYFMGSGMGPCGCTLKDDKDNDLIELSLDFEKLLDKVYQCCDLCISFQM